MIMLEFTYTDQNFKKPTIFSSYYRNSDSTLEPFCCFETESQLNTSLTFTQFHPPGTTRIRFLSCDCWDWFPLDHFLKKWDKKIPATEFVVIYVLMIQVMFEVNDPILGIRFN